MNKAEVLNKLRGLVAEIESAGTVTWADEPKTLTPQEALRALADGECIEDGEHIYKLCASGIIMYWARVSHDEYAWDSSDSPNFSNMRIAPHPPQPVEPPQPAMPPLKVGDRVRPSPDWQFDYSGGVSIGPDTRGVVTEDSADGWVGVKWDGWVGVKWDGGAYSCRYFYGKRDKYRVEKIEDESQPGYPLTYEEARRAAESGAVVVNDLFPSFEYWISRGVKVRGNADNNFSYDHWDLSQDEIAAKWRIVEQPGSKKETSK